MFKSLVKSYNDDWIMTGSNWTGREDNELKRSEERPKCMCIKVQGPIPYARMGLHVLHAQGP